MVIDPRVDVDILAVAIGVVDIRTSQGDLHFAEIIFEPLLLGFGRFLIFAGGATHRTFRFDPIHGLSAERHFGRVWIFAIEFENVASADIWFGIVFGVDLSDV